MAELVERYSITGSGALAEALEGYTILGRTERGKLYGEKDGQLEEIGRSAADILFTYGEKSGELVKIEPVAEDGNEMLLQDIQRLEELLSSERRQHAEEIRKLTNRYETEIAEMRRNFDQYKNETDERLKKLESPATINPESVKVISEKPGTEPTAINESLHPGDKVRVTSSRGGLEGFDTVEEVIRDDEKVAAIRIKNSGDGEVRSFPPGVVERVPAVVGRTGAPGVIVEEEERRGWWPPDRRMGGAVLAAAGVAGAVIWEVLGEPIFGFHDGGVTKREITNIINNNSSAFQHQIATDHAAEMKAIAQNHHNEMQAIHGVYKEVGRDHRVEMGAIHHLQREELKERITGHPLYFGFRYPWDWAANKVGIYRASPYLHELAAKAANHSHRVQWFGKGRREMLEIDGTFNPRRVIGVLNQYRK